MSKNLELYIHIPFCLKKCAYCDFLSAPADENTIERYVSALIKEIESKQIFAKNYLVSSIFIGGGTPSLLSGEQMEHIFNAMRNTFEITREAEITVEANPGTVTEEKLQSYRRAGINRLSLGLQSTNNHELKELGRIHTYEEFVESYQLARECGFDNINVDLISAIPNQTLTSWEEGVQKIIALNPEHVSAYSLIIEEGTPFFERYGEGRAEESKLPSEQDERLMYQRTGELLAQAGYIRYEISNYAKPGKECKHNLGYWERKEYLGLGLGASSLIDNVRFTNIDSLDIYMECAKDAGWPRENIEQLSVLEQMEETIFLGLRKMQGISISEFHKTFKKTMKECYGNNIERMIAEKLLVMEGDFLRLTKKGIDVSNYVFAEILK